MAYPIYFTSLYRDYLWGGELIAKTYKRETRTKKIAESWEISDRDDGMSVVANGKLQGKTLRELIQLMGEDLLGKGRLRETFPLLIKILDARESLSVQVHPNDETARLVGGEAKTEMWYVLQADPKAFVYAGLKEASSFAPQKIESMLEKIEIERGDAIYVPGGCVHAIGAGSLLFEVQQNSNTTYRIYDWERLDKNGKPRGLHLEEAKTVMNDYVGKKEKPQKIADGHSKLVSSPYFQIEKLSIESHWEIERRIDSFQIFFCLEGEGKIEIEGFSEKMHPGKTLFVPACFQSGAILGSCQVIRVTL